MTRLPLSPTLLAELIEQENPAVLNAAPQVFEYVVQAVDAETVQGIVAERVINATKALIQMSGADVRDLATRLPAEMVPTVRRHFV